MEQSQNVHIVDRTIIGHVALYLVIEGTVTDHSEYLAICGTNRGHSKHLFSSWMIKSRWTVLNSSQEVGNSSM